MAGVEIISGVNPVSGMVYQDNKEGLFWTLYGGGSLPYKPHSQGIRSFTLIPKLETEIKLKEGVLLNLIE